MAIKFFKKKQNVVNTMNELLSALSMLNNSNSLGIKNKQALNKIFGQSGYYRMLVNKRGIDVAKVELYLKNLDDEDNNNIYKHELLEKIKKPNNSMFGFQFRKLLQIYYDNLGEIIIWKAKNIYGEVTALYPINPADVIERGTKLNKWKFKNIYGIQGEFEVDNKDIIYLKDIDPDMPYGAGIGQGQALSDELSVNEKIMKLIGITFDNKAVPPFIITFDGVSETEVEAAGSKWLNNFKGITNYAKPMFTNSKVDVKKLAYNFEETKIVEIREKLRNELREIWGIPKELIGDLGNSNRASSTNAWNIYADNIVKPNIEQFVELMQYGLIEEYNIKHNTNFVLCYKNPSKADEQHVLNVMKSHPFAFTANEIRRVAHHEEWEGEKGKEIFVPLNFTSYNGNVNRGVPANDLLPKDTKPTIDLAVKKKEQINDEEEEFTKEELVLLMLLLSNLGKRYFYDKLYAGYFKIYFGIGTNTFTELKIQRPFETVTPVFANFMTQVFNNSLENITETLAEKIREGLQEGIKNKATKKEIKEVIEKIKQEYIEGSKLDQITETEANSLINSARLEGAIQSGVIQIKDWITQKDNLVRDSHTIDGQRKRLEEPFILNSGNLAQYPGDVTLPAQDRISCRCFLGFIANNKAIAGETEEERTQYWTNAQQEHLEYKEQLKQSYKEVFESVFNELKNF